jgi:hypothetical protein
MATTSRITLTNGKGGVKTVSHESYARTQKMLEKAGWFPSDGEPIKPMQKAGNALSKNNLSKEPPFVPQEVIDMRAKKEETPLITSVGEDGTIEVKEEKKDVVEAKVPEMNLNLGKGVDPVTSLNPDGTPKTTASKSTNKKK